MKNSLRVLMYSVLITMLVGIFFIAPLNNNEAKSQSNSIFNDLEPFFEAISVIRSEYIEKDIDMKELVYGAIRGMISELEDPYSRHLDPITFQREQENIFMGHFGGLGITITSVEGRITVIAPMEDTPAYEAGIKSGDIILEIDGITAKGMTLDEVVNVLRGEIGTSVTLTVERENEEDLLEIEIIRDTIMVVAVKEELMEDEKVGYIRISTFNANTVPELKEVLDNYQNSKLEGIIVDLRNNPGGTLDSAIEVASQFIKEGNIVKITSRNNVTVAHDTYGNKYPDWPLVVLVNRGSASASEIVAGALQDSGRGTILGEKSFGKGLVQQIYPLSDESAVIISTSEYYTPKGRIINNIGIEPDIIITIDKEAEKDIQLEAAIDLLLGRVAMVECNEREYE